MPTLASSVISSMRASNFAAVSPLGVNTFTFPSSSTSIFASNSALRPLIIFPPGPMMSRILSGFILTTKNFGACGAISARGAAMASCITPKICNLPSLACSRALLMISRVTPLILISICSEVIPSDVPTTLKSMSPRWSSSPRISDRITVSSPS